MKRIILTIFALLLCAVCVTGCAKEAKPFDDIKADLEGLEVLSDTIKYTPDGENKLDADYLDYYFGNSDLVAEDYIFFTSSGTSVCEVGVFKVSDKAVQKDFTDAFKKRGENLATIYENYSPDDTERAQNIKIGSTADYVWFSMTSDNAAVTDAINK